MQNLRMRVSRAVSALSALALVVFAAAAVCCAAEQPPEAPSPPFAAAVDADARRGAMEVEAAPLAATYAPVYMYESDGLGCCVCACLGATTDKPLDFCMLSRQRDCDSPQSHVACTAMLHRVPRCKGMARVHSLYAPCPQFGTRAKICPLPKAAA